MSSSGTQSPPLEATGEQNVLGASSIDGTQPKVVQDSEQRGGAQYDQLAAAGLGLIVR
jgi:hypothetical protein